MWQDTVIALCQLGAIAALIPIIKSESKPALLACAMNFVFAGIISVTLSTLELWYATTTAACISLGWLIIGVQKIKQTKA